ncbi:hypothetical protein CY34DRAFT_19923 [Suillus luteus UH-Slu-Lm8-n1]|uniref:Unplaced genomic scaffold CY34scaffold_1865, whole genome shotgun sequence n=1 Tax=Suillus luteus UH-Slu-Lm8-n1 TaxID=930992 RepID=A0A0D0AHC1_9AGAM|nr:hypothetical protein CY34DRAFT_19923 [Suillus luteus UH-Slu-Lm8-n1]
MTRRKGKSSTQQTNQSSEATASGKGLHQPRGKARQLFGKFKDKLGFSDSRSPSPAPSNIEVDSQSCFGLFSKFWWSRRFRRLRLTWK